MANNKKIITKEGYEKLEKELEKREGKLRKEIADRLDEAAQQGDRSENAAYTQALEDYQYNESRIKELKDLLGELEVAPDKSGDDKVDIGDSVVLEEDDEKQIEYSIVGSGEGDPTSGMISADSAVGAKVIGKKKGDTFTVDLPQGEKKYTIKKIK